MGTLVYSDKSTYIGSFVAGQRSGYGVQTDPSGVERAGVWENDQFQGDRKTNNLTQDSGPTFVAEPLAPKLTVQTPKIDPVTAALNAALMAGSNAPAKANDLFSGEAISFDADPSIRSMHLAIAECWNLGALSSAALSTTVVVEMELTIAGKPVPNSIKLLGFDGGDDVAVARAFETALRAIQVCGAQGFDLPRDKYESWRRVELIFNPEKMRLR